MKWRVKVENLPSIFFQQQKTSGWMDGWIEVEAVFMIANNNQKNMFNFLLIEYFFCLLSRVVCCCTNFEIKEAVLTTPLVDVV